MTTNEGSQRSVDFPDSLGRNFCGCGYMEHCIQTYGRTVNDMRLIDNAMKKYGYTKIKENEYGVQYSKREPQNFDHIVCVLHKVSGKHLFQSYDAEVMQSKTIYYNAMCGVEIPVLLLMWLKAKYLSFKYRWRTEGR